MNSLLGLYRNLYSPLGTISFFVLLIFNLSQIKYKKLMLCKISKLLQKYFSKSNNTISKMLSSNTFLAIVETIIISIVQYLPISFLNFEFGELVGTGANYFGLILFIPYILLLFCFLIQIHPLKQIDLITPAFPLALTISKLACFFTGCCRGIPTNFLGLYNHNSGLIEFPVQLLEAGIAFLIFIFLMFFIKKAKIGTIFPTYLIIYSATRFFSEFLRCEPNVFLGLKTYQLLCIIGIVIGIIELILVNKFRNKINNKFKSKPLETEKQ